MRPPNDREHSLGGVTCVHPVSANTLRIAANAASEVHTFSFDHVAQQDASQESIFRGGPAVLCICSLFTVQESSFRGGAVVESPALFGTT